MSTSVTLFISMFTTLLAIINPLEAIPVFLGLMQNKDASEQNRVARRSCLYALLMAFFFLLFGNLLLRLFGVPLSMIRVVGGIILVRIGFQMFNPTPKVSAGSEPGGAQAASDADVAFVPMAMPIMFGPGAIATIIGMSSMVKKSSEEFESFVAIVLAIIATMSVTFVSLLYSKLILKKVGPKGLDAITRIVGFFVSAMGMGLVFHGMIEFVKSYRSLTVKSSVKSSVKSLARSSVLEGPNRRPVSPHQMRSCSSFLPSLGRVGRANGRGGADMENPSPRLGSTLPEEGECCKCLIFGDLATARPQMGSCRQ